MQGWGLVLMAVFLPWSKAGLGISEGLAALGILFQWKEVSQSLLPLFKKSWSFWGLFGLYLFGIFYSELTDEGWKQLNIKHLLFTFPVYWFIVPLETIFKKYIRIGLILSTSVWCLLALSSLVLPDRAYPWLNQESGYRGGGTYFLNNEHPFAYTHEQGLNSGDSLHVSVRGKNLTFCLDSKSFSNYISFPVASDTSFSFVFNQKTSALWFFKNNETAGEIQQVDYRINGTSVQINHEFQHSKIPSPLTRRPLAGLILASIFLWMMLEIYERKAWLIPVLVGSLTLLTLLFLEARLGLIGAGIGFIWMTAQHRSRRNFIAFALVLLLGILGFSLLSDAFGRLFSEIESFQGIDSELVYGSANKRLALWEVYWNVAKTNSWVGTGVGDVLMDAQRWLREQQQPWEWAHWPHNQYLTALVQFGWLGGLFWLFFLGHMFFGKSNKAWWPILFLGLLSFSTDNTMDTQQGMTWLMWVIFLGKKH